MFLDNKYRLEEHTGYKNYRLKTVLIYTYIMYAGHTSILSIPKGILISDIHCIRHAGYKNMLDTRTLCAILNDVLITAVDCISTGGAGVGKSSMNRACMKVCSGIRIHIDSIKVQLTGISIFLDSHILLYRGLVTIS